MARKRKREDFHFYDNDCEICLQVHLRAFHVIPTFTALVGLLLPPKDFRLRAKIYRNLMAFFSLDCHIFFIIFYDFVVLRTKVDVARNHDRCKFFATCLYLSCVCCLLPLVANDRYSSFINRLLYILEGERRIGMTYFVIYWK